jgi:uncharacterized membrane protein
MLDIVKPIAEWCAAAVELIGLAIIMISALWAIAAAARSALSECNRSASETGRKVLGRGILFGLEFLVAGDIIHTVAVELSLRTAAVLAIVVLIRTFLSFTLHVELTGRWPWQSSSSAPRIGN